LLGVLADLAKDDDWLCATLGGRSIFVQRFGDALRGFENRCAHRFFPLRLGEKGNGPLICGFHHWSYDQDGRAIGIPKCREMFGCAARELDARLNPVEIATCGSLIFGRFAAQTPGESLEDYLGEGFPILASICAPHARPHRLVTEVAANWRLCHHITLDDYHIVAVHARPEHHSNDQLRYSRFGRHSAHFVGSADTLASMAAECRQQRYRAAEYRFFNIFPNLAVSLFKAMPYWYFCVQQFIPISPGRTRVKAWFAPTRHVAGFESFFHRLLRLWPLTAPTHALIVRHYIRKTAEEDHAACARLQLASHQIDGWPILGAQEERIRWFEEAYADALR